MLENRFQTMYIICSADAVFFYQYHAIVSFMYNKSCMYVAGFCTKSLFHLLFTEHFGTEGYRNF